MQTRNKKSGFFKVGALVLALTSAFASTQAWALTLGRLTAQSSVGQPLRATLEVPAISAEQASTLQIRVAGPDRFAAASMVLNSVLNEARFELLPPTNGQSSIRIQTSRPVTEPFLDLVLEFRWGGGQQLRTYTLLLDPPSLQTARPQDSANILAPALRANTAPPPRFEPLQAAAPTPAAVEAPAPTSPTNLVREVPAPQTPTAAQPTLSTAPPRPVLAQQESSLVRELPSPRLTEPSASSAPTTTDTPLVREVRPPSSETSTNLVRERTEPSQAPASQPTPRDRFEPLEVTSTRVNRGDTAASIAAKHLPPGISLDQMLVAMLQNNPQAFIDGNVNLMRADVRLNLPDFDEASQVSAQEARQLVRAQTRDFNEYRRRLATAAPTQSTPESGQTIAGSVQEAVEVATPAPTEPDRLELSRGSVSDQQTSEAIAQQRQEQDAQARLNELDRNLKDLQALAQTAGAQDQDGSTQTNTDPATDPLAIASKEATSEAEAAKEATPTGEDPSAAEKAQSFVEQWIKHPWTVPLALLLIAVLGLLGWTRARASNKQHAFQNTAKASAASSKPNANAPVAKPPLETGPAPLEGLSGNDPISEAEVYLAYGMDEQAENLLRQALAVNLNSLPERMKLLEIYQARADVLAFNTLAQEVFEITFGETEEWEQVARAGMKLDPSNPLYHPVHDNYTQMGDLPPDVKDLSLDLGGLDRPQDGNKRQP